MSLSNQCAQCLNFRDLDSSRRALPVCDAFPDGIPSEIIEGIADHNEPFNGDRGVLRIPIRYKDDGSFYLIKADDERKEIIEPLNLSAIRNDSIRDVYQYLLSGKGSAPESPSDSSHFSDWGYYKVLGGRRVIVTRELTRRINYVVTALGNPLMIFRDVQYQKTTGQRFPVEFVISKIRDKESIYFTNVRLVSDTAHRIFIARTPEELPGILKEISGVETYRGF
jgi:hypothetical protein